MASSAALHGLVVVAKNIPIIGSEVSRVGGPNNMKFDAEVGFEIHSLKKKA